jgi:hypothetical protein
VNYAAQPRAKNAADDRKPPVQNNAQKVCENLIRRALQIHVANYAGISSHHKFFVDFARLKKARQIHVRNHAQKSAKNRIRNALQIYLAKCAGRGGVIPEMLMST